MRATALVLLLALAPGAARAARGDEAFARRFLKTPKAADDLKQLERFLALDPKELPKKLGAAVAKEQERLMGPLDGGEESAKTGGEKGGAAPGKGPYGETRVKLARYFLDTPTASVDPSLVESFLRLELARLPDKMRAAVAAKQIEIRTLIKLHDTKKKGNIINPVEGCSRESGLRPMSDIPAYQMAGFVEVQEDERADAEKRTLCTEDDMVCEFSLLIFYDPQRKKPRRLYFNAQDPMMAIIGAMRGKAGGQTNFFGIRALSCMH